MVGEPTSQRVNTVYVCEVTAPLVGAGSVSVTVPPRGGQHHSRVTQRL